MFSHKSIAYITTSKKKVTAHICCCTTAFSNATDWPRFSNEAARLPPFPKQERGEEGKKTLQASYLFTFLCLPLNTTAKAPCPTRSFLLYSKSPTVSITMGWRSSWCWAVMGSLECCSPIQKIILEQTIHSVLVMLLLALRIYCMTDCSDLPYCINKRCSQDIMPFK